MSKKAKVLVVNSQSMYENNATGITLRNLLEEYGKENILEIYFHKGELINTTQITKNSIYLGKSARPLYNLFRYKLGERASKTVNANILDDELNQNFKKAKLKLKFKKIIISFLDLGPIVYDKKTLSAIESFKPDVIYTLGANITTLKSAYFFKKKYNAKFVLHFMDNWRETLFIESILMFYSKWKLNNLLRRIEDSDFKGITISEKMKLEYTKKSNKPYEVLMNCIDVDNVKVNLKTTVSNPVKFVYAGGLHLNRWKELLKVEKAINMKNAELLIYTSEQNIIKYKSLFDIGITTFKPFLPYEEVHLAYENSDILVHIESFDDDLIEFTKYSLSTKIPEYMFSNRPILCLAPSEIAVYEYIKTTKAGISVCNYDELLLSCSNLIESPELREKLAKNGFFAAVKNHSKITSNQIFFNTVN